LSWPQIQFICVLKRHQRYKAIKPEKGLSFRLPAPPAGQQTSPEWELRKSYCKKWEDASAKVSQSCKALADSKQQRSFCNQLENKIKQPA